MKKKLFITINTMLAFGMLQAQIVNLGGTITVQQGATLVVEGNVDNQSGTISNSGTIEIKGNLNNTAAGILSGTGGSYIFSGDTSNATITTNGDAINNLTIDKSGFDVLLTDPLTVNGALTFGGAGNSNLVLGGFNLNLGTGATVLGAGPGGYVEANGAGSIVKSMSGPAGFTFPVGDASNHMPLVFSNPTGAGAGSISARIGDAALKPASINNNFTNDHWIISSPNYGGDYTGTYSAVTGVNTDIKGFNSTDGTTFSSAGTGVAGSNTVTRTAVPAGSTIFLTGYASFIREFVLKAILQGPYNATADTMSTALKAGNRLPIVSPYNAMETVANQAAIPNDVVDWILVELVEPAVATTVYAAQSAFLRKNGDITNLAGSTTLSFSGASQSDVSIRIKHRNHLSVRSTSQNLTGSPLNFDFRLGTNIFTVPANAPMHNYSPSRNGLWCGDLNNDKVIDALDRSDAWNSRNLTGYLLHDCTLDSVVDALDRSIIWNNRNKTNL